MEPVDMQNNNNNNNNGDGDNNMYQPNMEPGEMINNNMNTGMNLDNNMYLPDMVPVDMTNNVIDGVNNMYQLVPVGVTNTADEDTNNANGDNNNNDENNNTVLALNRGAEELEGEQTSENQDVGSGSEQDRPSKKKRYHRHSQHQIQEMEAFFKECPHPDDKQRKELSRQLGISHLQIKFWFQNKRTQNKNHQERHENAQLRTENDKLRADNYRYRQAIFNAKCPSCQVNATAIGEMSFEEHHLRLENARLREEIQLITGQPAGSFTNNQAMNYPMMSASVPPQPLEVELRAIGRDVYGNGRNNSRPIINLPTDADKPMIVELAVGAMDELMMMVQAGEPLWMSSGLSGTSVGLNLDEYTRTVQKVLGPRLNGFRTEASREAAVVCMNYKDIVKMFLTLEQWLNVFAGIVSRAATHKVFSSGLPGSLNGDIHLMSGEFTVLSPLVPTRESYFIRYIKQQGEGVWAVVDVSMDQYFSNLCWRRPSGCLIQQLENGYSKVTWVEHVEVENREVHYLYKHLISTGQAFDANRWVSTLDRQSERLTNITTLAYPSVESGVIPDEAKRRILRLGDRMTRSFLSGVTTSVIHRWYPFHGGSGDDIRVMTCQNLSDPGRPHGNILCAASSFWVPVSPNNIFEFLRDESNRSKWDVIFNGFPVEKMSEIATGRDFRNCVTLMKNTNFKNDRMVIVQETSTDPTASYVIFAPVGEASLESVLNGSDPDHVDLLPGGFAILPDGTGQLGIEGEGSLVTVSFQMLVDSAPSGQLSMSCVATVENLVRSTMERIKTLFPYIIG